MANLYNRVITVDIVCMGPHADERGIILEIVVMAK